jgi:hypothetical protein
MDPGLIRLPDIHQHIRFTARGSHHHCRRPRNDCCSDYPIRAGQSGKEFTIGMNLTSGLVRLIANEININPEIGVVSQLNEI